MTSWGTPSSSEPSPYDRNGHTEQIRIKVKPVESDLLGQLLEEKWLPGAKTKSDLHRYALGLMLDEYKANPNGPASMQQMAAAVKAHLDAEKIQARQAHDGMTLRYLLDLVGAARTPEDRAEAREWGTGAIESIGSREVRDRFERELSNLKSSY